MDAAMWIGAYVFVTDGCHALFEHYIRRQQAERARDGSLKNFSKLVGVVNSITQGQKIFDSEKFARRIQPEVAAHLGLSENEAPSPSSIREAIREVKARKRGSS